MAADLVDNEDMGIAQVAELEILMAHRQRIVADQRRRAECRTPSTPRSPTTADSKEKDHD